ncbi:MAG: guanylate kinase [Rhodoluna sp.]
MSNKLTVLVGPTAVGKGTVVRHILKHHPDIHLSVSATTRFPRPGEENGKDYFFISSEEFDELIKSQQMLEYAIVHGTNKYGTPRKPVTDALARGEKVILEIDIQGARQIKKSMPEAIVIFIAPPSWEELVSRLESRGTESEAEMAKRLETARAELDAAGEFDHVVINNEVARCAEEVVELMKA